MSALGLSQLLLTDSDSLYYLTGIGYDPGERLLALYLNDNGDMQLFSNRLFPLEEQPGLKLCIYEDGEDVLSRIAAVAAPGRIGIDKDCPARFLLPLLEKGKELIPCLGSEPVDKARMLKDEEELALLRKASQVNDSTMAQAVQLLGQGYTEQEMVAQVGRIHMSLGADSPTDQLICYGSNGSEPHHVSDFTRIQPGEGAIFDIFTPVQRYWCDMTRTVFWQRVQPRQKEIYEIVLEANLTAIDRVAPGVPLCDIDRGARQVIERAGYGEYFTHRLGHGCGLSVHEPPDCNGINIQTAQPGMCFSIEPGIYLPGEMGVRIEDLVVVTETGVEVLNSYTKELQIIE